MDILHSPCRPLGTAVSIVLGAGPGMGFRGAFSWFPLHQDLIFDLGDPVRWEYMLLGTDKPHLSLTEEDDEGLDDDDDVDDLVSRVA